MHLTSILGIVTKFFFDSQQLIILGDTIGTRERASLDLPGVGRHRDVGYG